MLNSDEDVKKFSGILEITNYFFGEEFTGYAVEVGAFDGIFQSTTKGLEDRGWKVLLVEPMPKAFSALIKNRDKKYCLQYALGSENEDNVVFEIYDTENSGASFSRLLGNDEVLDALDPERLVEKTEILVSKRTLDFCLDEVNFQGVDLVSIDVEGGEVNVLKGFDLTKWNPKILIIENISCGEEIATYLDNYTFLCRIEYTFSLCWWF